MNEQATQTEIKAIQERLQAMRAGHHAPRTAPASLMVEMFPNRLAPANLAGNPSLGETTSEKAVTKPSRDSDIERRSPSGLHPGSFSNGSTGSATGEMRSPAVTTALRHALSASTETTQRRMAESVRETAQTPMAEQVWTAESRMPESRMPESRMAEPKPSEYKTSRVTESKTGTTSAVTEHPQHQETLRRLEAKAQQINQLSAAQETAMLELKAIATRLERDRVALELQHGSAYEQDISLSPDLHTVCEYLATNVPAIERDQNGAFVMTTRAVDLFKAERDAELMAQTLRHRNGTTPTRQRRATQPKAPIRAAGMLQSLWKQLQAIATGVIAQSSTRSSRHARMAQVNQYAPSYAEGYSENYAGDYASEPSTGYPSSRFSSEYHYAQTHSQNHSLGQSPTSNSLSYKASALWLGGAIVARIAANLVLASYPGFWIPVVGLMVAPAAIAVYRTTVAPQSSMIWGYRLFLVMMGLLVGGRLL